MELQARPPSFQLCISSNMSSVGKSVILGQSGQFPIGRGTFHLAILAGEAPRRTGIIQDKFALWTTHQLIINEPTVGFPKSQEDTSCKELEDHAEALYGCSGFCHMKSVQVHK
jgi:hypothetical protein